MNRREVLFSVAVLSLVPPLAAAAIPNRPNVLIVTLDDLGWDSLGVTGCKIPGITPCLDRLASEGVMFQHAHIMTSICGPSRNALFTGRYPHRPWPRTKLEADMVRRWAKDNPLPPAKTQYDPDKVDVPAFLPDLPEVRRHIAPYYDSVRRVDAKHVVSSIDLVPTILEAVGLPAIEGLEGRNVQASASRRVL